MFASPVVAGFQRSYPNSRSGGAAVTANTRGIAIPGAISEKF
jgi:hypothetical protein